VIISGVKMFRPSLAKLLSKHGFLATAVNLQAAAPQASIAMQHQADNVYQGDNDSSPYRALAEASNKVNAESKPHPLAHLGYDDAGMDIDHLMSP
jgi:hypothetical protein